MSDWASVRYNKKSEKPRSEGVNFHYEGEEDDDYDDDVQVEETVEEKKSVETVLLSQLLQLSAKN